MLNVTIKLKEIRESSKRKLFLIPYVFTFANAICGLLAVISALENKCMLASYYILCAACMDFIDGRLARALKTTSYLGMELDSLSDAISFCFAPTIVLYSGYMHQLGIIGISTLAIYVCSGIFRLARFNNSDIILDHFVGLPTTMAACSVVLLVLSASWICLTPLNFMLQPYSIICLIVIISVLMVSPICVPSWKNN